MTAAAQPEGGFGGFAQRRRSRRTGRIVVVGFGAALALIVALTFFGEVATRLRPSDDKTVQIVLPPPPPPPPPPPETKPVEHPPEPKPIPLDQPVTDTPPPPTPDAQPVAGDSALTAREGAGPSNYGLAVGNGGGTRIGSKAGGSGDGFAAYAGVALAGIRQAAQGDPVLARGRYSVRLLVTVSADGQITTVRLLGSTGDAKRDAALERRLTGLQLSQRPPAGLPVMRVELNARS